MFIVILLLLYVFVIPLTIILRLDWLICRKAKKEIKQTPDIFNLQYTEHFVSVDNALLQTWWIPASSDIKKTLVFIHGNARNISFFCDYFYDLHKELNVNIFAISLRGYGKSTGKASLKYMSEDVYNCINFFSSTYKIQLKDIIIIGRSQGASIAAQLAVNHKYAGVILESGISSINDFIIYKLKKSIIFYPYKWLNLANLTAINFDTYSNLKKINTPVLLIHGLKDNTVPIDMAIKNLSASTNIKHIWFEDAGHANCWKFNPYCQEVNNFIDHSVR